MEPFVRHTGTFVGYDRANVDTDAIIPARYLKKIERVGFGELLFRDVRYKGDEPVADFPLNRPEMAGATVLVARHNFGCGSSREHAVWAIVQAGFRAVIAPRSGATPGFADIFRNNSYKNGLLPVEVSPEFVEQLFQAATLAEQPRVTIDLQAQQVTAHLPGGDLSESFTVPEGARKMLLEGLDEIGLTLQHADRITAFEEGRREFGTMAAAA